MNATHQYILPFSTIQDVIHFTCPHHSSSKSVRQVNVSDSAYAAYIGSTPTENVTRSIPSGELTILEVVMRTGYPNPKTTGALTLSGHMRRGSQESSA